jgi:pantoate--beta-alanine ligase
VEVTLFVNPTQIGPGEDYLKYPRSLDDDLQQCSDMGVDIVFVPSADLMYPPDFSTHVDVEGLSNVLEGAFRPGHFRGVATVVLKLLNIVQPDRVYFGQKDFQQQRLISKMCDDLNVPVQIRVCPTVREPDGLALSSRNAYLNPEERQSALALRESLRMAEERLAAGETDVDAVRAAMRAHLDRAPGVLTDYATIVHPMTLEEVDRPVPEMVAVVAARVGATRLIDNLALKL